MGGNDAKADDPVMVMQHHCGISESNNGRFIFL